MNDKEQKISEVVYQQLDEAVGQAEILSTEQWREDTKDWLEIQKAITTTLRDKPWEFRKSNAKALYEGMGDNGDFVYLLSSLSDEALDRVIASFGQQP